MKTTGALLLIVHLLFAPAAAGGPLGDYGDAPDPNFPSLSSSGGPCHLDVSQEWIGVGTGSNTTVETESNQMSGDLDAQVGWFWREDSKAWFGTRVSYNTSISSPEDSRYLNVLIDINDSGTWDGGDEWAVRNYSVPFADLPSGVGTMTVGLRAPDSIDPTALCGHYMRITLSDSQVSGGIGNWGVLARGETEDFPYDCGIPPGDIIIDKALTAIPATSSTECPHWWAGMRGTLCGMGPGFAFGTPYTYRLHVPFGSISVRLRQFAVDACRCQECSNRLNPASHTDFGARLAATHTPDPPGILGALWGDNLVLGAPAVTPGIATFVSQWCFNALPGHDCVMVESRVVYRATHVKSASGAAVDSLDEYIAIVDNVECKVAGPVPPPTTTITDTQLPFVAASMLSHWEPTPGQPVIDFGGYTIKPDGKAYARPGDGERWDWDSGAADPLEGWTDVDLTAQVGTFFRHMTEAIWTAEMNGDPAPTMNGYGFILCGARKGSSDSLAWAGGAGYGNNWCQRLTSPTYTYDGSGSVDLTFTYFNQSELNHDFTHVNVVTDAGYTYDLTQSAFTGDIGIEPATGGITPATFTDAIINGNFGAGTAARNFNIVVEFKSDDGASDQDGGVDTWYGPFGMDDFTIGPLNLDPPVTHTYSFEPDLQGWVPGVCPGVGSYFGVANIVDYIILDPCSCSLTGNVVKLHDGFRAHPDGQHVMLYTPIIDRENDIPGGDYLAYDRVMAEWDQYADLPTTDGVFYRSGWTYYPYTNPVTGDPMWSPRVGIGTFYYAGGNPACQTNRNIGTDWGLPTDTRQLKFIYELYASCAGFAQVPCAGTTNLSPLIDNVRVRNFAADVQAPVAHFGPGTNFQDGFGQSALGILNTTDPGNADVVRNLRRGTAAPSRLGDSLVVEGPNPTPGVAATRWEARLWFRLNRTGPGQAANAVYTSWHGAVAGAKGEFVGANANFAWGYMDSVESGTGVKSSSRYRFCSRFRDGPSTGGHMLPADMNYNWGGTGEFGNGNAILPDLCFTPGTNVQYFVTSNYVDTPLNYEYYPDTTGKNYYEFEILPSFRTVGGVDKFPCMLYINASETGESPTARHIIEKALNIKMNGLTEADPIPDPTTWDRYDYGDASSNWNASFYRTIGGTAGATIPQMLGYKLIMVNAGALGVGCMEPRDWQGFQQWMEGSLCDGNINRQGFIANGNSIGEIINTDYPLFLTGNLGATHTCRSYNEIGCPNPESANDENYCTSVDQIPGFFNAPIPTDVWANWCPAKRSYGVLGVNPSVPTAAGNKYYEKIGAPGVIAEYAQVVNDRLSAAHKYRTVIDGFSYHMLIRPNTSPIGTPLSAYDCRYLTTAEQTSARIGAAAMELENAITWTMGSLTGLCVNPCTDWSGVPDQEGATGAMTRLYQNRPNPFNPRTEIRFSLAADSKARLVIYDVNGRRIRTLVDKGLKAGTHSMAWDGMDDFGHSVPSGVYWSQLQAGDYTSNRKMTILK